jgi:cobalt/nickel transport system permease protein
VVLGAVAGSVAALALGATGVVLETTASGISTLPLGPFALLMVPLHLAIGVVEGLVTGTVVLVLWQARPELVGAVRSGRSLRPILVGLTAAVLLTGGVLSWFASQRPDGLEWSVATASGGAEGAPSPVHAWLARIQGRTAILPDHDLAGAGKAQRQAWPAVSTGTSLSGLLGSTLVLGVAAAAGALIRRIRRR